MAKNGCPVELRFEEAESEHEERESCSLRKLLWFKDGNGLGGHQ